MHRASLFLTLLLSTVACSRAEEPAATAVGHAPPAPASGGARPLPPAPAPAAAEPTATTAPAAEDPRALIAAGAVVVDVRTPEEFASGHLPQAVNIPIDDFATRIAEIDRLTSGDRSKQVVLYCGSGKRAERAERQLAAAGYTRVVNGGGYDDVR